MNGAEERALAFLTGEWPYYDGIEDAEPNRITVTDVLAPVMVNAYSFGMGAAKLRDLHRAFAAACESLLAQIPAEADLRFFDHDLVAVGQLLKAAVSVPGVLLPVATKILFRKRRMLIPILDNVVIRYYLDAMGARHLRACTPDKRHAADIGMRVLRSFRDDLLGAHEQLAVLSSVAVEAGYPVSPLRLLEVLVWTEFEPRGYYRSGRK